MVHGEPPSDYPFHYARTAGPVFVAAGASFPRKRSHFGFWGAGLRALGV